MFIKSLQQKCVYYLIIKSVQQKYVYYLVIDKYTTKICLIFDLLSQKLSNILIICSLKVYNKIMLII